MAYGPAVDSGSGSVNDLIRKLMMQQGMPEEGSDTQGMSPEDFIRQQLAGDVVPMRTHPPTISDVNMRLRSPGVGARSQGMQSIERFGDNPYMIDLMDVLNMQGREPRR